jgi:FtsZ-interacting cell division protein ZipA
VAGPPDEPPTRRIDPVQPPSSPREMEVVTEDPAGARAALLDELRSLKRTLAIVGIVAIAALGVALWALLSQEEEGDAQRGASNERVSQLEDRVDELEGDVENAASDESVSKVRQQQEDLTEQVEQLSEDGSGSDDAQQAVEQVQQDVEELGQRLDDLEQQQQDSGGGEPPP